jgi:penicillin-binding protein 1A
MSSPLTAGERLAARAPTAEHLAAAPRGQPESAPPDGPPGTPPEDGRPSRRPRKPRRRRSWMGRIFAGVMGMSAVGLVVAAGAGVALYNHYSEDLPDHETLTHYQPPTMSRVYAGDSRLLAELATERRIFVPYEAIPERVKQAFISAEDQNFFLHKGVDPIAIARAAAYDIMQHGSGRRPIGASTITQQVAKNMLVGNEVSIRRKIREAIVALRIEQSLSKERILELYLNEIYLGLQAYGVTAAAQSYFNKSLAELTLPEAAFIAALPKAPNNYNPFRFPEAGKGRRDWVIERMAEDGAITAAEAAEAKATPLVVAPFRRPETVAGADYFAEEVRRQLIDRFGPEQTTQGGLTVRTTVDPILQAAADKALRDGLMRYDQRRGGWRGPAARVEPGPQFDRAWPAALAAQPRPPGMLPEWRLAVVVSASNAEARLGVLERAAGAPPSAAPQPRLLPMALSDLAWARPVVNDRMGPAPRRMEDVLRPGDVVMAEIIPATAAQGRTPARAERLALRQVPQVQGALVALDPATGRVLALSGGWSFETSQFNRATQALRQPGSSFKPYVYLSALRAGISPSQRFLDAPFVVNQGAAGKWRPANYGQTFSGPVSLRVALEKSLNLVTVRVADKVGMEAIAQLAIALGVVDDMPRVLPAALGAVETTVLRQAGAYASFIAGGRRVEPTLIDAVQDRAGRVIWRAPGPVCDGCDDPSRRPELRDERAQVVDPQSSFQLVTMLQGAVQRGTGNAAGRDIKTAVAGKTGTSQDFQDNWFAGFTPDMVTVVWVGFDTPASLGDGETGGSNAAPIWRSFMQVAQQNRPPLRFIPAPGMTLVGWDSGSGTVTDAFKPGQEPGYSAPVVGVATPGDEETPTAERRPAAGGVDSTLGGLY